MKTSSEQTNYDNIAVQYSSHVDKRPFNSYYERPYILSKLGDLSGKTFLDAGCGSGFFSVHASNKGSTVTALDASEKMLQITKAKLSDNIETHVADLGKPLDMLKDNYFDIIVCSLALHYVEDITIPINEFYRILKPNGVCIVSTHHPISDYLYFNKENYFDKRLINDEWKGFGDTSIKLSYYVRPLNEYLNPFIKSKFKLESIDEPSPISELKEVEPEKYYLLKTSPAFLFFNLRK